MTMLPLRVAGDTHRGMMRQVNEDNCFVVQPGNGVTPAQVDQHGTLLIAADGVGGNRGGKRASELAVTRIPQHYYVGQSNDVVMNLRLAIDSAAREIVNEASMHPELANMGCTVAAAVIKGDQATVAHLGDARVYLLRGGQLKPLTKDHSWVQEQVDRGTLTESEARAHPNRNVITKSLGNTSIPAPTINTVSLQNGDRLLLCSDGLCGVASDAEMATILGSQRELKTAVAQLIQLANHKGGPDNVTAVVAQAGDTILTGSPAGRKQNWLLPVGILATGIFLFGLLAGPMSKGNKGDATPTSAVAAVLESTDQPDVAASSVMTPTSTMEVQATVTNTMTDTQSVTAAVSPSPVSMETGTPVPLPTPTIVPTLAPTTVPKAVDLQPQCDQGHTYSRDATIDFQWQWTGQLAAEQYLEVRVSPPGIGLGAIHDDFKKDDTTWNYPYKVKNLQIDEPGDYGWTVHYMGKDAQENSYEVSTTGAIGSGCFSIKGGETGGGNDPAGTKTAPTPKPTP